MMIALELVPPTGAGRGAAAKDFEGSRIGVLGFVPHAVCPCATASQDRILIRCRSQLASRFHWRNEGQKGNDRLGEHARSFQDVGCDGEVCRSRTRSPYRYVVSQPPICVYSFARTTIRKGKIQVQRLRYRIAGVSNFTIGRIQKLQKSARIPIAANQVELNLNCAQPALVEWCIANNIIVQSYSPLGSTGAVQRDDSVVVEIAKAHGVDPANILISWQVARGAVVLPKSVTPSRIVSNFKGQFRRYFEFAQLLTIRE